MKINKKEKKFLFVIGILITLIFIAFIISLNLGSFKMEPIAVIRTLIGQGTKKQNIVLFKIRLPRIIIAILVATALSVAGTILQGITKNDLADPGILGISSGAALSVVMYIYFMNGNVYDGVSNITIFTIPIVAFFGAAFGSFLIYIFAWKKGINTNRLILMGIGINAVFSALLIIFQLRFTTQEFNRVMIWTLGSLWGTDWRYVMAIFPGIIIATLITFYKSRYLDVLNLSDEIAIGLGIQIEKERRNMIILTVVLAGIATAVSGTLAFIGLISPHIARNLVGAKHKLLIPTSALIGTLLLLIADTISRNLIITGEMPVGIIISVIGVPYFVYLMIKQ